MNWDRIEGNWKQFKGKAKEQWGKLTDDDLDVVEGKRDQLAGRLQERYGYAKDQASTRDRHLAFPPVTNSRPSPDRPAPAPAGSFVWRQKNCEEGMRSS